MTSHRSAQEPTPEPLQDLKHRVVASPIAKRMGLTSELSIVWLVFTISLLAFTFLLLTELVEHGSTHAFDVKILLAFRNPADLSDPIGPGYVEELVRDITAIGGTAIITLTTIAAVGFLAFTKRKALALVVLVAVIGSAVLSFTLKQVIDRSRPDLVPHGVEVYNQSFPSGHATQAAGTYLTLGALLARSQKRRRVKIYIVSLAAAIVLLVGLSRIYLGVHWPTDVVAGWTVGSAWALLMWMLARWLQTRGMVKEQLSE